jgi:hypothetical protein
MGKVRGVYKILVGKPEGNSTLGRPCRKWEYNIKADLREVGCGICAGWSWLRIETGTCECGDELSGSIKAGNFLIGCKTASFSRRTVLHGESK